MIAMQRKPTIDTSSTSTPTKTNSSCTNSSSANVQQQQQQSSSSLSKKLLGDVLVAGNVSLMITPFMTVIDKAVVERAAAASSSAAAGASRSVSTCVRQNIVAIARHPLQYVQSPTFKWMWFTYAATYSTANTLRTITSEYNSTTPNTNRFLSSSELTNQQQHQQQATTTSSNETEIANASQTLLLNNHHYYYGNDNLNEVVLANSPMTLSTQRHRPNSALSSVWNRISSSVASISLSSPLSLLVAAPSTIVFVGTTAVNSTASILKDRAYARMFTANHTTATATAKTMTIPKLSYGLWILRDFTVIGSSFVVPSYISHVLQQRSHTSSNALSLSNDTITKMAQLLSPIMAQVIATPFHYIGLDCYNRPNPTILSNQSSTAASYWNASYYQRICERVHFMKQNGFREILYVRMVRVLPGYGIGGIYNTSLRNQWNQSIN